MSDDPTVATAGDVSEVADALATLLDQQRLTPAQRRIARYVMERPAEVTALDASELAERSGSSQPSVTRFSQVLGFSGYPALRRWLRTYITDEARAAGDRPGAERLRNAFAEEHDNLRRLEVRLSAQSQQLQQVGVWLATTPVLPVVGLRASAALAQHIGFFAKKLHPHVEVLVHGGTGAIDALHEAADAGATTLLGLALPRVPNETITLLSVARELGLSTVVVTDTRFRPVGDHAEVVLPVGVGEQLVFDSQAAVMMLGTVLLDAMADADAEQSQRHLERFERRAAAHDYFDQD